MSARDSGPETKVLRTLKFGGEIIPYKHRFFLRNCLILYSLSLENPKENLFGLFNKQQIHHEKTFH